MSRLLLTVIFACVGLANVCRADIIVRSQFIEDGDTSPFANGTFGGPGGAAPTNMTGTGTLSSIMSWAVNQWTSQLVGTRSLDLYYTWQPRGTSNLGSALTVTSSTSRAPSSAYIRISSDVAWFADGTPNDHSEFSFSSVASADMGGGLMTVGRNFSGGTGDAAGRFDLATVVLHEVGHALGWTVSGNYTEPLTIRSDLPFAGAVLGTTRAGGAHLSGPNLSRSLMDPLYDGPGTRALISDVDLVGLAQLTGDSVRVTSVPEPSSVMLLASSVLFVIYRRQRRRVAISSPHEQGNMNGR